VTRRDRARRGGSHSRSIPARRSSWPHELAELHDLDRSAITPLGFVCCSLIRLHTMTRRLHSPRWADADRERPTSNQFFVG
jgi:hypothetical protein